MSTILALDIGTDFVKAIIAKHTGKGSLEIIGVGKAQHAPQNISAGAITDIPAVTAVCEQAILTAEQIAGQTANLAVVGIAGELIKSHITTVNYARENPEKPIFETEMQHIIQKVQEKAGAIAKDAIAIETDNSNVEIRLINSAIVALTIDGYKVNNPIGFKGSNLSIQFYTAFAPLIHTAAIEKICAELNLDLLAIAVEPFAICRACLGDNPDSHWSGIILDIGGNTTDVAIIDDGNIKGTKVFSIGGRNFTHQIATNLDIDFTTAENYKTSLQNLNPPQLTKLNSAIVQSLTVWFTGVEVALEDFDLTNPMPKDIFLCGGGASLTALQETLAISDWYLNLPFSRRPIIHLIDITTLPDITINLKTTLDHSFATAIGLLRVSLDTLISIPEQNTIRTKFAKLLQK